MSANLPYMLDDELKAIESQLAKITPRLLSKETLLRMEVVMGELHESDLACSEIDAENSHDLTDLEVHLSMLSSASMPEDMLERMTRAMDQWHEHVPLEEKVISFEQRRHASNQKTKVFGGGLLSAAAAVALLGAAAALAWPKVSSSSRKNETFAEQSSVEENQNVAETSQNKVLHASSSVSDENTFMVTSDAFSQKVVNTTDQGVVYSDMNTPLRCIRVEYINRVKVKDDQGREIEIDKPGVDYMFVPVETN